MKFNIAIGIVVFEPKATQYEHIQFLQKTELPIYVVDNSKQKTLPQNININFYFHNANEGGLAKALNILNDYANQQGKDWLLTLDQDSKFNSIEDLEKLFSFSINVPENIGAVAPRIMIIPNTFQEPIFALITSGMLLRMKTWRECGKYREDFFIDSLDTEYCLRMRQLGWNFLVCEEVILEHSLGNTQEYKLPFRKKIYREGHHSALRRYYIARNLYVTRNQYRYQIPEYYQEYKSFLMWQAKKALAFDTNKLSKLIMMFAGFVDGFSGHMGKFDQKPLLILLFRAFYRIGVKIVRNGFKRREKL
jgi:rhamnosyltransferase